MQRVYQIALAMDNARLEKTHKLLDNLYKKIKAYNKEVEHSNKLLREQESLRKKLGIRVEQGKVKGLKKKEDKNEQS